MIPITHQGLWAGPNRLWLESPKSERSEGRLEATATSLRYSWSFRDKSHEGRLELFGPTASMRAEWQDSFHAASGMTLHGASVDGAIVLYGTYSYEEVVWGWRIELDARDPEHLTLRMFNVEPTGSSVLAVELRGARDTIERARVTA